MTVPVNILTIENLSKKYRRATSKASAPESFRELVSATVRRLFTAPDDGVPTHEEDFWALRNVNLALAEGTRLGVIGRNGAGKSTLLKVLSRITEPTEGKVEIRGRTASLLEIGTGFHPELTGRENIYLNGALLGMGRGEIRKKLDAIVAFAEIEKFLDEPVKHYSSGMYVRLAFAIAAHVDPDILILDEVLAVGDVQFQRKCFGKVQELGQRARSVIFVSHDLAAVSSLCNRCIVLDSGRVLFDGRPSEAVMHYYGGDSARGNAIDYSRGNVLVGDADARLLSAEVVDESANPIIQTEIEAPVIVRMRYWLSGSLRAPAVPNIHFHRADGTCAFVAVAPRVTLGGSGNHVAEVTIPGDFLNEGMYSIGVALTTYFGAHFKVHFYEQKALMLNVRDPREPGGLRYGYAGDFPGVVRPHFNWTIERTEQG